MRPIFLRLPFRVAIKKNGTQRKYSFKLKRTITCASDRYMNWEQLAVLKLKDQWRNAPITQEVELRMKFYFKNKQHQPDVDNCCAGPKDALQKAGVIKNDKLVRRLVAETIFNDPFERVEIELREYI